MTNNIIEHSGSCKRWHLLRLLAVVVSIAGIFGNLKSLLPSDQRVLNIVTEGKIDFGSMLFLEENKGGEEGRQGRNNLFVGNDVFPTSTPLHSRLDHQILDKKKERTGNFGVEESGLLNESIVGEEEKERGGSVTSDRRNTFVDDHRLPKQPLHSCTSSEIVFPNAQVPHNKKLAPVHIDYQCGGKEYEEKYDQVMAYAQNETLHPMEWGRREFPIPKNKTVFMMGNSHSRQIFFAMLCQFADQVIDSPVFNYDTKFGSLVFANHAKIIFLFNPKEAYSLKFHRKIEKDHMIKDIPFSQIDAFIIGFFNIKTDPGVKTSNFYKDMMKLSESGNTTVDFLHVMPPTVDFIAEHFSKPIVSTSMFLNDRRFDARADETSRIVSALNRSNVRFIPARKHMDLLGRTMECSNFSQRKNVSSCDRKGHTCMGYRGSHPDLIVHDFSEALYELL